MSSARSVLVLLGLGAVAANAGIGCSSTPGVGFEEVEEATVPASLPEAGHSGDSSTATDASRPPEDATSDALVVDASADAPMDSAPDADAEAGPPDASADAGAEGTPCAANGAVGKESCGLCGFRTRLCASNAPGNPNVWQPWGFCQSEVVGGCFPGSSSTESCGKCGTRARVCQMDCQYAVGACKNEPANACTPGTVDYQLGLSCPAGGRSRTCEPTCTFGVFGACFVPGEPTLTVIPTVGEKATGQFKLVLATATPRLSGTCPTGSVGNSATAYQYVILDNPSANTVKVSAYTGLSTNAGAAYIDTVIASYPDATKPATDVARKACVKGVNDSCSDADADACVSSWAGLVGANAVTIAPNSKVLVYVGAYFANADGDYQLTARTDTVTP